MLEIIMKNRNFAAEYIVQQKYHAKWFLYD